MKSCKISVKLKHMEPDYVCFLIFRNFSILNILNTLDSITKTDISRKHTILLFILLFMKQIKLLYLDGLL